MAKKITLELDAYKKLHAAKRERESFSSVVQRVVIPDAPKSGSELVALIRSRGPLFSESELDELERIANHDSPPDNPWDKRHVDCVVGLSQ
ncbi:antitoxin VapB family protein [Haloferula sp.]|uniref:antitoxin VapB family protein n=1 Tax=Haloferula sp. TaxID=2497595 RepID=UPI003C7664BB